MVRSSKCLTIEFIFNEAILMAKGSSVVHYDVKTYLTEIELLLLQSCCMLLMAFYLICLASSSALRLTMILSGYSDFK